MCVVMFKHTYNSPREHVSPVACMRCNVKTEFRDLYKGELPVPGKPGRILTQLVTNMALNHIHDIQKHNTRESYTGLPLSEEHIGGRQSEAQISGFRRKTRPGASEFNQKLMWKYHMYIVCCHVETHIT